MEHSDSTDSDDEMDEDPWDENPAWTSSHIQAFDDGVLRIRAGTPGTSGEPHAHPNWLDDRFEPNEDTWRNLAYFRYLMLRDCPDDHLHLIEVVAAITVEYSGCIRWLQRIRHVIDDDGAIRRSEWNTMDSDLFTGDNALGPIRGVMRSESTRAAQFVWMFDLEHEEQITNALVGYEPTPITRWEWADPGFEDYLTAE